MSVKTNAMNNGAASTAPIIAAKKQVTITPPPTTTAQTTPKLSEYISQKYDGVTTPITKGIRDIDSSSLGGNFGNVDLSVATKGAKEKIKGMSPEEIKKGGSVEVSVSADQMPPASRINNLMNSLYDEAESRGIKTAGMFSASFNDLLKSKNVNQKDVQFLLKYGKGSETGVGEGYKDIMDIDKLRRTAAEHYSRIKKEKDDFYNNQRIQAANRQAAPLAPSQPVRLRVSQQRP